MKIFSSTVATIPSRIKMRSITMALNSFAAPHSNNLELALQRRLAKPPTPPTSSWERETGRGIGQYSFGEYRLPVQIKVRSDEVVISEDCSLIATRVWDCSVLTAKWMEHLMNQKQCHLVEALRLKTSNPEKVQILELGAGTGLLSIYLAKSGCAVLSTEYGSAVKYLKNNCDRNQVTLPSDQMTSTVMADKVHCRELDWYKTTETLQTLFQEGERAMFDLIVVTDCSLTSKESQGVLEMIHKYGTPGHTKVVAGVCNEREGTPYFIDHARNEFNNVVLIPTLDHHPDYRTTRHTILSFPV
jgi:hypothetical protein